MRTRLVQFISVALVAAACGSGAAESVEEATTQETTSEEATSDGAVIEIEEISVTDLTNNHIDPPATFPNSPALGGDHYPFWMNCGFYDVPVIEGAAVHSLEHGAVWITYSDAASEADVQWLRDQAASNDRLLISPYDHAEPIVASAWGRQLRGDLGAESPKLVSFIEERADHPDAPEAGVSCGGVVGIPPNDVRTLVSDGSQVPPEWE